MQPVLVHPSRLYRLQIGTLYFRMYAQMSASVQMLNG